MLSSMPLPRISSDDRRTISTTRRGQPYSVRDVPHHKQHSGIADRSPALFTGTSSVKEKGADQLP
jgi:hypothetical protein